MENTCIQRALQKRKQDKRNEHSWTRFSSRYCDDRFSLPATVSPTLTWPSGPKRTYTPTKTSELKIDKKQKTKGEHVQGSASRGGGASRVSSRHNTSTRSAGCEAAARLSDFYETQKWTEVSMLHNKRNKGWTYETCRSRSVLEELQNIIKLVLGVIRA